MLLCPTCYYGSAQKNDIDFATFTMLFDAIFKQGLARPEKGIRAILDPITQKLEEFGVKRMMNRGVKKINFKKDSVTEIILENGNIYSADHFISTCGIVETEELLNGEKKFEKTEVGEFSVIETISVFQGNPKIWGGMKQ